MQLVNSKHPTDSVKPDKILGYQAVEEKIGLCQSSFRALGRKNLFPQPIPLTPSGGRVGWLESEVDAWIQQRAQQAREQGAAIRRSSPNPRARVGQ